MIDQSVLFHEKQRFRQWWVLLLLAVINARIIYGLILQIKHGIPFGNQPMSDNGLRWFAGLLFLVTIVLLTTTLETRVKHDGIYVRFFPIHFKFKHISWADLNKCYVRTYSPLREYGGWGWRIGLSGRAYNVSGKKGLQLHSDGKKLLIGTQKPEELESTLKNLKQWKYE